MKEDADIQKALESVILYKVDAEKGEGPELAKEHMVQGYPTFVLANAKVQTLDRWLGYGKEEFIADLADATSDLTTIEEKMKRFAMSPTEKDAAKLARYQDSIGEYGEAEKHYRKAAEMSEDNTYAMEIFDATYSGFRRADYFTFDQTKAAAKTALEVETDGGTAITVANMMMSAARKAEKKDDAIPFLETAIKRTEGSDDESIQHRRANLLPYHALYVEKDADKAFEMKKAAMPEGWMDSSQQLNSIAWWCFENKVATQKAHDLAKRGVELAEPGSGKAAVLDTQAELCNELDDCATAVELIKLAIKEDPDNEYYKEQLTRFEELLAQKG